MPITTLPADARFTCGSFTVDLASHQWDFVDGAVYLFRDAGIGPTGTVFRDAYDIRMRQREMTFIKDSTLMESFRQLSIHAGATAIPVKFYPDVTAAPGTFWTVDWPEQVTFRKDLDNRESMTVRVMQQSPGA